jgi:hypothetical protein
MFGSIRPPNCVSSDVHCLIGAAVLIPPRGTRFVDFSQSYQTTGTGFTLAGLRWLGVKSAALRYNIDGLQPTISLFPDSERDRAPLQYVAKGQ